MAVIYEARDRIAFITLNRPDARNAVNAEVANGVEAALDKFEGDPNLWVAILSGAGKVFCAGADLKEIAAGRAHALFTAKGGFAGITRRQRDKPIIAAITGSALAGGTEIALSCDLIICAQNTIFGLTEVRHSLAAAAGGLFRLPRAVGMATALEAILTGDPLPAQRAYELGMVNKVVPPEAVMDEAVSLANRIIVNAPLAVQASRRIASRAFTDDDETLWKATDAELAVLLKTEDFKEGPRAFVEKRAPRWQGK